MTPFRRVAAVLIGGTLWTACDKPARDSGPDGSAPTGRRAADAGASAGVAGWPTALGPPLLVVVGDSGAPVIVSEAPSPTLAVGSHVTFFTRTGTVQRATVRATATGAACTALAVDGLSAPLSAFAVGVAADSAIVIPADSLESLGADSAAIVRQVTSLASVVPSDTGDRFRGLPFVLLAVWRFTPPSGTSTVVATFRRRVPLEASPLEERTLVVAERDSTTGELVTVYAERVHGTEESVDAIELLAAIAISGTPTIVLARDYGDGLAYSLVDRLEEARPARWGLRWTSPRIRC